MVDVFEEVDEQIRSDHYKGLARRYLPWIGGVLGVALLVALGVWGYGRYQLSSAQKASLAYAKGLDILGRADFEGAYAAFADAAKSPSPAYRSMGLMQQAGIRVDEHRQDEALVLFAQAAKAAPNPVLADVANLKSAYILMDEGKLSDAEALLKPLSDAKRPYSPLALEALAMAKVQAGHPNDARSDFVRLSLTVSAPDDVKQRAQIAMMMIDANNLAGVPAIVTAARALPPLPPAAEAAQAQGPDEGAGPDSQNSQAGAAQ